MKAQSGTPEPSKGFSGQGQIFSARQGDYSYLNVQKQPTNYNTKSATFHTMNEIVKYLDATYDSLPADAAPPEPSQDAWDEAAEPYASVAICGCPKEAMSGKKFFRLVNWNIAIAGGALILYPLLPGEHWQGLVTFLQWVQIGDPRFWYVQLGLTDANGEGSITLGIGKGVDNPQVQLTGANPQYFLPDAPDYNTLTSFADRQKINYCLWNTDGVPAGAGQVIFSILMIP